MREVEDAKTLTSEWPMVVVYYGPKGTTFYHRFKALDRKYNMVFGFVETEDAPLVEMTIYEKVTTFMAPSLDAVEEAIANAAPVSEF